MSQRQSKFAVVNPYLHFAAEEGLTRSSLEASLGRLVTALRDAGATGIVWYATTAGVALYPTRIGTRLSGDTRRTGRLLEAALADWDILEAACAATRNARLETLIATRVYDERYPGLGSRFEAEHQSMLWESRCGEFRLPGVLCPAYDEVRAYWLACIEELAAYDADVVAVCLDTSAAALTPFRRRDFYGFNEPVAQAVRERTGRDIRAVEDARYRRGPDLQIVDAVYEGERFDHAVWHEVKGEFFEMYLAEASHIVKGAAKRLALCRGREEGPLPMARHNLPADKWLRAGIIDDLFLAGVGSDRPLSTYLEAAGEGGRVLSPAGGCHGYAAPARDFLRT